MVPCNSVDSTSRAPRNGSRRGLREERCEDLVASLLQPSAEPPEPPELAEPVAAEPLEPSNLPELLLLLKPLSEQSILNIQDIRVCPL